MKRAEVVDLTGEEEEEIPRDRQERRARKRQAAAASASAAASIEVVELLDDDEAQCSCGICLEELPLSRTVLLSACQHRFCITCSGMHVRTKILDGQVSVHFILAAS